MEPQDMPWRHRTPDAVSSGARTDPDAVSDRMIPILAGDVVSAQQDAHVYRSLIERLRNAPSDATADAIVDHMQMLGMASASWPEAIGGPPPHHSLRPWRTVLDWLVRLAAQTARMLFDLVDKARTVLSSIGVSAVGIELSVEGPGVSFEFPIREVTDDPKWNRARMFLDGALAELEEKVFS